MTVGLYTQCSLYNAEGSFIEGSHIFLYSANKCHKETTVSHTDPTCWECLISFRFILQIFQCLPSGLSNKCTELGDSKGCPSSVSPFLKTAPVK